MNSQPSRWSSSSPTVRVTRADLSPVTSRLGRRSLPSVAEATHRGESVIGLRSAPFKTGFTPLAVPDFGWDPHLIDRLQAPLTRYHD